MTERETTDVQLFCNAEHWSTGAICELPPNHKENHRGQFENGIAQWPRETSPEPSALEQRLLAHAEIQESLGHSAVAEALRDASGVIGGSVVKNARADALRDAV